MTVNASNLAVRKQQAKEGREAWREYQEQQRKVSEQIVRLRALRLAKTTLPQRGARPASSGS
jgi:hypothetical protein